MVSRYSVPVFGSIGGPSGCTGKLCWGSLLGVLGVVPSIRLNGFSSSVARPLGVRRSWLSGVVAAGDAAFSGESRPLALARAAAAAASLAGW